MNFKKCNQALFSCARMFENDSTLTLRLQTLTNEANIGNSEKLRTLQKLMKLFLQKGNKKYARLNNSNLKHRFDFLSLLASILFQIRPVLILWFVTFQLCLLVTCQQHICCLLLNIKKD